MFWKKNTIKDLLPFPVQAEHAEYSMIFSARDRPAQLTSKLLDLSLKAIRYAAKSDLGAIIQRSQQALNYGNLWPGEHYRLLIGFVKAMRPNLVIEIGTSTGLSSLAFRKHLPKDGKIVTFDIKPWAEYPDTLLQKSDFEDAKLIQYVADLGCQLDFEQYSPVLEKADLIFIDATHDGILERQLMENFQKLKFKKEAFVLLDDIRIWTMLKMWREITLPKIDLTSFGHWSGTGLVELSG